MFKPFHTILCGAAIIGGLMVSNCSSPTSPATPAYIGHWVGTLVFSDSSVNVGGAINSWMNSKTAIDINIMSANSAYTSKMKLTMKGTGITDSSVTTMTDTGTWVISGTKIIETPTKSWIALGTGAAALVPAGQVTIDTESISGIVGNTWTVADTVVGPYSYVKKLMTGTVTKQ